MRKIAVRVVVGLAIYAAIAIPNVLEAINRSKQKRTMAALRDVATAWEAWQTDAKVTGPAIDEVDFRTMKPVSAADLRRRLVPRYAKSLPAVDGWGHSLDFAESGATYAIRSRGRDGVADGAAYAKRVNTSFDDDLVYANGDLIRYPEGL